MSYWTFTDIFEENGPAPTPFHGGFGLLNLQGIKSLRFSPTSFWRGSARRNCKTTTLHPGFAATTAVVCKLCSGI